MTRLRYPFLLKFTRNTVFIADFPGGASPPPGMPSFQGPERLADYLCAQGIEYVAYSYCREAGFPRWAFAHRLRADAHPWHRAQAEHTLDFQANLTDLGYSRYRVYDDGARFVLDLGTAWDGASLGCVASGEGP